MITGRVNNFESSILNIIFAMDLHRRRTKSVEVLEDVKNAYAILGAPNEEDHEAYLQVYGRCHLETKEELGTIQQRLNALENASTIVPSPQSHTSSIEGVRYELTEMNDHLQESEEAIDRRLDNMENLVGTVKDNLQELDERIDGVELCLLERIDEVEKNMDGRYADLKADISSLEKRFDSFQQEFDSSRQEFSSFQKDTERRFTNVDERFNKVDERFDKVDERFDKVDERFNEFQLSVKSQFDNLKAFHQNGIADRFYATVAPAGVEYLDSRGHTHYRFPPGPSQPVKYYWKMHLPKHHGKLKALHEFYSICYKDWSANDDSSEDDDNLDLPTSLEAAIARYPAQAVRILFAHLGLVYSKFEEQARKLEVPDHESGKTAEKRAARRALPLGAPKSKIRRQSPSIGSAAELRTGSSTQSHDSVALVGYDQ